MLGALSIWPLISGGGLLPCLGRHFQRPENGAEPPRQVQSRHDLVCDQRLSTARPESQGPVFVEIGGTHQSGLGTEGVRLLWSLHISIFLIFVRCVALRNFDGWNVFKKNLNASKPSESLSDLLLRTLVVGRRQQSESIEAALDME